MVFRKNKQAPQEDTEPKGNAGEQPKYPKPKILLIDVDSDTEIALRAEGYRISTGSLGTPYQVEKTDGYEPIIPNGSLELTYAEQEIVVVDLEVTDTLAAAQGEKPTSPGQPDWWARCSEGVIDPRPRFAVAVRDAFDRILSFGGVFIIFAAPRFEQYLIWAHTTSGRHPGFVGQDRIRADNWSFLSLLDKLDIRDECGEEASLEDQIAESPIGSCLSVHVANSPFRCTLHPTSKWLEERWVELATSKYGDTIAGLIILEVVEDAPQKGNGLVFILPPFREKPRFLVEFLKELLPDLSPHLFPFVEGSRWVQRPEYELPEIVNLEQQILAIREETEQKLVALEQAIESVRADRGYLHDLLQAAGRTLVLAVQKVLNDLGFESVVDVDAETEKAGDQRPKREDLQIHDTSPVVLVEVKGISQLPKDSAVLQVWKYIAPRMREWDRTDIRGLSIINHQRYIPALQRENAAPFREDLLTNAEEHQFGLLTTWDLFRLVRSYTKNGWKPEYVKPLFYQNGRIEPVPRHYEFVGNIEHFWPKAAAVGVRVEAVPLSRGDRIAFELPVEFEEQVIESLQTDREPVERVARGQLAGIATHLTKEQTRKGVRVFRVRD